MTSADKNARHAARMARKKAVIDAAIEQANQEKGLLLVLTGNGKGKSSSAFGMMARALGYGMKVGVAQFIKSRKDTGEEGFFSRQPNVEWHVLGEGFTWDTQDRERDIQTAQAGWEVAKSMLNNPEIGLVILDELTYTMKYGYLDTAQILADIAARPPMQHVVVTGRAAPQALIDAADTVSEIMDIKHAWRAGIKAQPGIDL
ncbi:MAG: cob(I)yrinic acid a,c-diamide adenosyltransferase [Betaproteobacteria bacterium HGW-Betaproteobacteria-22]|nr:MAG: cob(I)yrinic acid a,c-diamide adenosyltransferase [Betaproteobacteria bacterium HGW-Betaproteobacteria-22]